ncbi:hypothetical protein BVC71_13100 [Marivivens niveibacter]|uniref:Carbohydrate kinase PfkB domain-containing protein n=1 Tax=Marivivens niveibacter TaxID=1930667 RepID=A0A251WVG6_9RHOB|nr:sugar kinase [Marivivens niveibacter]OUD08437.1 hypothetical protein BVC71_13100 [Marivivens niveibacter]
MRIVSIGECMVELSGAGADLWRSSFAGDTFNTAWYARAKLPSAMVDYVTCVGSDPISDRMVQFMSSAGIGTEHINRHPTRSVGLYMIELQNGERSFSYWRDQSAARCLADDLDAIERAIQGADYVYLSGITLAILPREKLGDLLSVLSGSNMVFDPNLRPRLWENGDVMRADVMRAAAQATVVLPSFEDEQTHFNDQTPFDTAQRYADAGATEIMVKNGGGDMVVCVNGACETIAVGAPIEPVDTTGAGDSFNGAYLAARLAGQEPHSAARAAHETAARVIQHRGALMDMGNLN